jgi:hypothetical protein
VPGPFRQLRLELGRAMQVDAVAQIWTMLAERVHLFALLIFIDVRKIRVEILHKVMGRIIQFSKLFRSTL